MPLDAYKIGKTIGKGSYGEVSLARHKKDGRQFVIKKIDLHNASTKERNFAQQEVDILSKMNHPNIVAYKESFQDENGFLYIIMGYCEGGDMYRKLKEQAEKGDFLPEPQIVEWFVQIAMGLQYMHNRNILHRDLKTQNIFLTKTKIIKLGDLGIARVLDNTCDMATTLIGTPYYMSPEIFSNKPYNHKSDIWALGCCLYEMTSLKHAFNAKDMNSLVYKILRGKMPPMPRQYTQELCDIIRSMLAYDPAERPSVSKILRQQFIKRHIMMFLEGTKQKQNQQNGNQTKYTSRSTLTKVSKDSGVGDSFETESQNAATASDVQIEVVADPKERKEPYVVKVIRKAEKRPPSDEKPRAEERPRGYIPKEHDPRAVQAARDRRRKSRDEPSPRLVSSPPLPGERAKPAVPPYKEQQVNPASRPGSHNTRSESAGKKARVNRPLPALPANVPGVPSQIKISKEQKKHSKLKEHESKAPAVSAGVPNPAARQRRRQRFKEEDIRRSKPSISSVSTPRATDSPDGMDSVDGSIASSHSQASNSEDDAAGSDVDDVPQQQRFKVPDRKSSDIGNLIETLQETLSLGQRPGSSERSSPEDVASNFSEEKLIYSPNASGRLQDRISRLRRECIRGLGEEVLAKSYSIIDEVEEDSVEAALVTLMGRTNFEIYGGLIWQLKFCEEFRV